ncbi:hypothetical protein C8R47DRAFT_574226 [Mycena vitilis]|nr:hypothetical protein C8R47DRAFT_574226 [Mycena vitilis]
MVVTHPLFNTPPRTIPADAQIVPQPPYIPEPPHRLVYGWLLEPALFGPDPLTLVLDDDVTGQPLDYPAEPLKHPTTVRESYETFELVLTGMQINDVVTLDWPHPSRPHYAYLAEASKDRGVHSPLDGGAKTIPAWRLKVLKERLQLVKDPEWIQVPAYSPEADAALERALESVRILNLSGMAAAAAPAGGPFVAPRMTPADAHVPIVPQPPHMPLFGAPPKMYDSYTSSIARVLRLSVLPAALQQTHIEFLSRPNPIPLPPTRFSMSRQE